MTTKVLGFLAIVAAACVLALTIADHMRGDDAVILAARDTMRVIVHQRDTLRDTIRVYERRVDTVRAISDALDADVEVVNDSTLYLRNRPERLTVVPPVVVANLQALRLTVATQDTALRWYREDRRLDSLWHIQDAKLPHKPPRRISLGVTAGYACAKTCGLALALGVSYRIR